MVTEADWVGLVQQRTTDLPNLSVDACLQQAKTGISNPFLALGSDGQEWWVKSPQRHLDKALITEFVVGKVGSLIGAPVCRVEQIYISDSLLPWEMAPGRDLVTGLGTASLNLDGTVTEVRRFLTHRGDDDNARRHAGAYALVDWCFGSDLQWLHQVDQMFALTSHDHGWYLPPSGPTWHIPTLRATVNDDALPVDDPTGLDQFELNRLAIALRSIQRADIAEILNAVPTSWPASNEELECLGWFLEARANGTADRLDFL